MTKNIKNFYKRNKWISRIGICALLISLSYVITYNMPDYLGIEPIYAFLNNVSISYIAALIFFVVQIYIPEERNRKKCMQILSSKFEKLIAFVEVTILVCEKYFKIKDKGAEIHWNTDPEMICFKYSKNSNKSYTFQSYSARELKNLKNEFGMLIKAIKEMPIIQYCDYDVLEKLTEIEKSTLFDGLVNVISFASTEVKLDSFNNNMEEMKKLINDFKKLCLFEDGYFIEEVETDEKVVIDLIRTNPISSLSSIENFNRKILRENLRTGIKKVFPEGEFSEEQFDELCNMIYENQK